MLFEFDGVCQFCKSEVTILINEGELQDNCPKCHEIPFTLNQLQGIIYIVSNPNQRGVKIGRTKKTVSARCKELSSTGVPGSFEPIAIFPSKNVIKDEKKVHDKLKRKKIEKEHFDVSEIDGVLAAHRALNKREPIFFENAYEERFHLELKKAKIEMQLRLKGKK